MVNGIVRDISERKKLEDERQELFTRETDARHEAEKANRVKDEFLATLSHELRTPLTTILIWAQILLSRKVGAEKTEHAIAVIERSAKDQGQLIDDLLDVSRIQAGKMPLELRQIELTDYMMPPWSRSEVWPRTSPLRCKPNSTLRPARFSATQPPATGVSESLHERYQVYASGRQDHRAVEADEGSGAV